MEESILTAYPEGIPYSTEECIEVIGLFFSLYRFYRGEEHPNLKQNQLRKIMLLLPDVDIDLYPEIIEAYFQKRYRAGCDYRINHFFSGKIRETLLHECGY